jgi:hypothetical protein
MENVATSLFGAAFSRKPPDATKDLPKGQPPIVRRHGTRGAVNANGRRANAGPFGVVIGVEPTAKVANPRDPTVDALGPHGPALTAQSVCPDATKDRREGRWP